MAFTQDVFDHMVKHMYHGRYGHDIICRLKVVDERENGTPNLISFQTVVDQSMLNPLNTLHGGACAILADVCTSFALAACNPEAFMSTTVDLHLQFLSSAILGDTIQVQCTTSKVGSRMAYLQFTILNLGNHHNATVEKGAESSPPKVMAVGTHTKYILKSSLYQSFNCLGI
ncbi:Acyl-coenzyme A thioesterase 13 [Batrachochytrium dendrobatidis]|nr:Acyl-coenzyme A thioesterase 13 [Batrachochytrium dendrobatidis]KAK5671639.1 Acyl-coenzyme A thioesterase 13 [Batrachochytrium dendrobatidis]